MNDECRRDGFGESHHKDKMLEREKEREGFEMMEATLSQCREYVGFDEMECGFKYKPSCRKTYNCLTIITRFKILNSIKYTACTK